MKAATSIDPFVGDPVKCRKILLAIRKQEGKAPLLPSVEDIPETAMHAYVERLVQAGAVDYVRDADGSAVPVRLTYVGHDLLGTYSKEALWLGPHVPIMRHGWRRAVQEVGRLVRQLLVMLLEVF